MPERRAQRLRAADELERVVAAVGRVAAADDHPQLRSRCRRRRAPRRRSGSPSRRTGPCRASAVSSAAVGSQPARVDDHDGQVGRPDAGVAADRVERGERVAQVGGDARCRRGRARATASTASASTSTQTSVASGAASRAAARESLPAWPAPSTQTVAAAGRERPHLRRRGADVEQLERPVVGNVGGHQCPTGAIEEVRGPGHLDLGGVGVDAVDRVESQRDQRQRGEARDAGTDLGRVGDAARRPPRPCRAGCRRSRSPGCASCRGRPTISAISAAIRSGSPPPRSRRLRCEVESRQSRSTASSTSYSRTGRRAVEAKRGLRQHPGRLDDPPCAEPPGDFCCLSVHERTFGNLWLTRPSRSMVANRPILRSPDSA